MPFAAYTAPKPLGEAAEFFAMLKTADGTACPGATVHIALDGPGFLLPGDFRTGGRIIFVRTDESGGVPFRWVKGAAPATDEPISLQASAIAGTTLIIREI
ncbi:MAG: hypothetical protein EPO65_12015 [Dehalococcoidia bacterium]|nr:MAG: hypothetical protein EPO65_12015 [Dehalococcoidia bacterium]